MGACENGVKTAGWTIREKVLIVVQIIRLLIGSGCCYFVFLLMGIAIFGTWKDVGEKRQTPQPTILQPQSGLDPWSIVLQNGGNWTLSCLVCSSLSASWVNFCAVSAPGNLGAPVAFQRLQLSFFFHNTEFFFFPFFSFCFEWRKAAGEVRQQENIILANDYLCEIHYV